MSLSRGEAKWYGATDRWHARAPRARVSESRLDRDSVPQWESLVPIHASHELKSFLDDEAFGSLIVRGIGAPTVSLRVVE